MRIFALLLVLVALIGAAIGGLLQTFGHFRSIEREFTGQCLPVTGVSGPEDMAIVRNNGLVFISSLERRMPEARGAIHLFNPANPLAAGGWQDVTNGSPETFRPLGISYFEDSSYRRLFVVNEAVNGVELYDVGEDGTLVHLESFTERRLTSPNNIVAVGPSSFYVTNDVNPGRGTLTGTVQFLTRQASGEVFFSDGKIWQQVASGLRFANGIAISPDGEQIYVAEMTGNSIVGFSRDTRTNALNPSGQLYNLTFSPDNISIDEDGRIWVAGLPKPLSVPRHESNPENLAPSQVAMIKPSSDAKTVYLDDGSELSASTVASYIGDVLLIGALYENKFLLCDLPSTDI